MTREEVREKRKKALQNYLAQNEEVGQMFVSASREEREEFANRFYTTLAEEKPEYGKYVSHQEARQDFSYYPGGPRDPLPGKDVHTQLYDATMERMYDHIEGGVVDMEELSPEALTLFGQLLHARKSPKAEDAKIAARSILDGQKERFRLPAFVEGVTSPAKDLALWGMEKSGADTSYYYKQKALEDVAYPANKTWEGIGELAGVLGGSIGLYAGLAKKGLSTVVQQGAKGARLAPGALAATAVTEFGLGWAYDYPTFILSPENPNRVMSGLEAMFFGTAMNLGIDTMRALKGKPKAEVVERLDEMNPEGWTEIKEGLLSRYADADPDNVAIAQQMARDTVIGGEPAKSALQGKQLADEYRRLEEIEAQKATEESRRVEDFAPARQEELQQTADDLQAAMQGRQIPTRESAITPAQDPIPQTGITPEYKAQVEMDDRLNELNVQRQKIQERPGKSAKESRRIEREMQEIRQRQVQEAAQPHLTKEERIAEDMYPGSVLGIHPYAAALSQTEVKKVIAKELGLRTTAGTIAATSEFGEEHGRIPAFLLGFGLMQSGHGLKAKGRVLPSLRFADGVIKPADTQIKEIDTKVWNDVQGTIYRTMKKTTARMKEGLPFFDHLDQLVKDKASPVTMNDIEDLTYAIYTRDKTARNDWFSKFAPDGSLAREYQRIQKVFDDLAKDPYTKVGYLEDYFPRLMKDYDMFKKIRNFENLDEFSADIRAWELKHGVTATQQERMEIILNTLQKKSGSKPFYEKHRRIMDLEKRDLPAYENLRDSFANYISDITYKAEINRFLGKGANGLLPQQYGRILGDSVGQSIDDMLERLKAAGQLAKPDEMQKLKNLLSDWIIKGRQGAGDGWGAYRNFFYATTIGNPWSALSQIPDLAIMATKDPAAALTPLGKAIKRTGGAMKLAAQEGIQEAKSGAGVRKSLAAAGKKFKETPKLDMGFDWLSLDAVATDIMTTGAGIRKTGKELLANPKKAKYYNRFTHALLNKSLKWGGFKALDMAMKGVGMDVHFHRLQKWAKAKPGSDLAKKMERKYKPAFGDDYDQLVKDLQEGKRTDLTELATFNEITQIHPLDSIHMPPAYIKHPKGRLMYSLKSFMLRHINFMRTELIADIRNAKTKAERKDAWKTYGTYVALFGGATMGTTMLKDFGLGRDVTLSDRAVDSMIQTLMGINRFQVYQARDIFSSSSYSNMSNIYHLLGSTTIPANVIGSVIADVVDAKDKEDAPWHDLVTGTETIRYAPVIGKDLYWRLGKGEEKEAKKKAKELHKLLEMEGGQKIQIVY